MKFFYVDIRFMLERNSMENEVENLKRRVTLLEQYREKDKSELHQLDTSLQVFISEMKNISEDLKTIVSNSKEAVMRSTAATEKEISSLKEQFNKLEKQYVALDNKVEQETVVANSEKWKKVVSYVVTAVLGAVLAIVFAKIGMV